MSGVGEVYRNFEAGGYWGVADFFRHIGISDRCVEEGGKWKAAVITHYRPGLVANTQTYVGPDGYQRRASIGSYPFIPDQANKRNRQQVHTSTWLLILKEASLFRTLSVHDKLQTACIQIATSLTLSYQWSSSYPT
jgi:hypothetical protein